MAQGDGAEQDATGIYLFWVDGSQRKWAENGPGTNVINAGENVLIQSSSRDKNR